MRPAIALALLLNVVFVTAGVSVSRGKSCCCSMKSGGSCPLMKRCGSTCSMSAAQSTVPPRLDLAVSEVRIAIAAPRSPQRLTAIALCAIVARNAAPEVPPPRA